MIELALTGARVYVSPDDAPIDDAMIVLSGRAIVAVGPRAGLAVPAAVQRIDCSGLTITAGFWNSHVHFFERKWANAEATPAAELERQLASMLTSYGFTDAFDLGSPWENTRRLRERIASGEVRGPRVRSTGEPLFPPGSLPPPVAFAVLGLMSYPVPEVSDAATAERDVAHLLDAGVDGIKLFTQTPAGVLAEEALKTAVRAAHERGKITFAHPGSRDGLIAAVRGGVDVIAHTTPPSGPWDAALIDEMHARKVVLIPTLYVWEYNTRHDRLSVQQQTVATAVGQLRAWLAAGGTVLFGTDGGYVDSDPRREYELMEEAGMSFRQILASLTTAPAERFGEGHRMGRIASGFSADLVVLRSDPEVHGIRALADVEFTIRSGEVIYDAGGQRNIGPI